MKIEWVSENYSLLTLMVDGEAWRKVHSGIFGRKPKEISLCQSLEELEAQFSTMEYQGAKAFVFKRLSLKPYLTSELERCLEERLVSTETIQRIIAECARHGFLNDQEWLENYVRRLITRNQGPMAIVMKLKAKGISQKVAESLLEGFETDHKQRIQHLLDTRYRNRDLSDFHTREKVIASLIRKGFSFSDIKEVFSHIF